jgi:hypothetical protein
MGGPRHPILDVDVNDNGKIDAVDMENLKKLSSGGKLSLKDVATSGNVASTALPKVKDTELDYGSPLIKNVSAIMRDGTVSPEEAATIAATPDTEIDAVKALLQTGIMSRPGADSLRAAVETMITNTTNKSLADAGVNQSIIDINAFPTYADEAQNSISILNAAIDRLGQRISQTSSQAVRQKLEEIYNGLNNKRTQLQSGFEEGAGRYAFRPVPSDGGGGGGGGAISPEVRTGGTLFNAPIGRVVSEKVGSIGKTLKKLRI